MLKGVLSGDTFYYSVILEGDEKTLDSTDNSIWTVPKTALFVHSGLDPIKKYTLRFRNWSNDYPNCPSRPDGENQICCQTIDSLTLIGSAMRFNGCVFSRWPLAACPDRRKVQHLPRRKHFQPHHPLHLSLAIQLTMAHLRVQHSLRVVLWAGSLERRSSFAPCSSSGEDGDATRNRRQRLQPQTRQSDGVSQQISVL